MNPARMFAGPVVAGVISASAPAVVQETVDLVADDFSRFPPGPLAAPIGQLNGAIQEYHSIEHRGERSFPWRHPIVHHDSWAAGDERTEPYLEQHLINDDLRFAPLFVTGDKDWRDYRVEVSVRPLSLRIIDVQGWPAGRPAAERTLSLNLKFVTDHERAPDNDQRRVPCPARSHEQAFPPAIVESSLC